MRIVVHTCCPHCLSVSNTDGRRTLALCGFQFVASVLLSLGPTIGATIGDEHSLNKARAEVRDYKRHHGEAPSNDYYFALLSKYELTNPEQATLHRELLGVQRPMVSVADLIAVLIAKRDTIETFDCEYTVRGDNFRYVFDGGKVLVEEFITASKGHGLRSFDGDYLRVVNFNDTNMVNASISEMSSRSSFMRPAMPLCMAMAYNPKLIDSSGTAMDLARYLEKGHFHTFEQEERVDESNCLVVASLRDAIWLDIDRGFSLVQLDSHKVELGASADGMIMTGRSLKKRRTCSEFRDYGNGLWLPFLIKETYFTANGKVDQKRSSSVSVQKMDINKEIPESAFTDVIPEDAMVTDGPRGLIYRYSDRASIDGLLGDYVKSKRSRYLRNISVFLGILLIVMAVIRGAHTRKRQKTE